MMRPFPLVRIRGWLTSLGAMIEALTVRGPRCADHLRALPRPTAARAASLARARRRSTRLKAFEGFLPAGVRLEIRVTRPGFVGKHTLIRIRAGRPRSGATAACIPARGGPGHARPSDPDTPRRRLGGRRRARLRGPVRGSARCAAPTPPGAGHRARAACAREDVRAAGAAPRGGAARPRRQVPKVRAGARRASRAVKPRPAATAVPVRDRRTGARRRRRARPRRGSASRRPRASTRPDDHDPPDLPSVLRPAPAAAEPPDTCGSSPAPRLPGARQTPAEPLRPPVARRARRRRGARGRRRLRMVARRRRDARRTPPRRRSRSSLSATCSSRSRPPGRRPRPAAGMDAPGMRRPSRPTAGPAGARHARRRPAGRRLARFPPRCARSSPRCSRRRAARGSPGSPAWTYGPIVTTSACSRSRSPPRPRGVLAVACSASPATWSAVLGCETGVALDRLLRGTRSPRRPISRSASAPPP